MPSAAASGLPLPHSTHSSEGIATGAEGIATGAVAPAEGMAAGPKAQRGRAAEMVTVSGMGVVSVLNYAYTLALVWLLPAREYAVVGSASALLLICGTISAASVPWVLAREVARGRHDPAARRAAVSFCLLGTVVESLLAGGATAAIASSYGGGAVVSAVLASVVTIFSAATVVGYLQGMQRFNAIASLRVAEVAVKVAVGLALVSLGAGAAGAIAGFAAGAAFVMIIGGAAVVPDLRIMRSALVDRRLWGAAGGLLSVQAGVAIVASADIVIASIVVSDRRHLATYLVAQVLARIPIYVGTGLSMVVFPRLAAAAASTRRQPAAGALTSDPALALSSTTVARDTLRLFLVVCVPIAVAVGTLPGPLAAVIFPGRYGDVESILAWTAAGGVAMGTINLVTTFFQAADEFFRPSLVLAAGVVVQSGFVVAGIETAGIYGLAVAAAAGGALVAAALWLSMRQRWPGSGRGLLRPSAGALMLALPLVALRGSPEAWLVWAVAGVGLPALLALYRFKSQVPSNTRRPQVLHLALEDPKRPGAGGGSVRTQEVNRRLADEFEITVVCARYRSSRSRIEEGVRYVHVGLPLGYLPSILAYFACIPYALVRFPSDLVVEDFAAPFSSVAVPLLTGRPVVAVVQWLFAKEKALQYRVPFHWVERAGARSHVEMVAVSEDLACSLRRINPSARVTVVANGLSDAAFLPRERERSGVVYLGRLEVAQKGLDLGLRAFARAAHRVDDDLTLAGDGPDRAALEALAAELGIGDRVHFLGRIAYEDRFDFLAGASLVVMPSRYETFGMVAAEAMAQGTPVLAFDIPCLRALVNSNTGKVVPAFDVEAFADSLTELLADPGRRRALGEQAKLQVAELRWDELAPRQAEIYRAVLGRRYGSTT